MWVTKFMPSKTVNSVCQYLMPTWLSQQQCSCLSLKHKAWTRQKPPFADIFQNN